MTPEHIKQKIEDEALEESSSPSDYEYLKKYYTFGYSLAQQEIERLKGLIKPLWESNFYNIPIPDNTDPEVYEQAFNNAWQQFKTSNNL